MRNIKIYGDVGSIERLRDLLDNPLIEGFTTNPSLMAKGGVKDYEKFAREAIQLIHKVKPNSNISLEVFSDDELEMGEQAMKIHNWGKEYGLRVYVKVPIVNVDGTLLVGLIERLVGARINLNVTCVCNASQYFEALTALMGGFKFATDGVIVTPHHHIISIFAGRIADTGVDPKVVFQEIEAAGLPDIVGIEKLWASPRETLNIFQAEEVGCDIITLFPELIAKIPMIGRHLRLVSMDTSKMFFDAAHQTGYSI